MRLYLFRSEESIIRIVAVQDWSKAEFAFDASVG